LTVDPVAGLSDEDGHDVGDLGAMPGHSSSTLVAWTVISQPRSLRAKTRVIALCRREVGSCREVRAESATPAPSLRSRLATPFVEAVPHELVDLGRAPTE